MVHRAPDSRLLTHLIDHEKEYTRQLAAVFPLSHSALASLSAYAAASPPSQHTLAAVVDVLASADDALQRYAHALEVWRVQLVALKDLEDDLCAVLRDRDILVTRLIKASKSTRDRSSRLVAPLTSLGSASLSSLPSTNSTAFTHASSPASTNAKLAQAQAELQACEAHLVSKESELDARRITLARDGLGARCRALIDCGRIWGEMGRQGLRALQALGADGSASHAGPKQLPSTYASDISSLTPSQSASQTAARSVETSAEGPASNEHGRVQSATISKSEARSAQEGDLTITLPPAHAISELALPTGVRQPRPLENGDPAANAVAITPNTQSQPAAPRRKRRQTVRPPSQHIPEASDEDSDEPSSNVDARNTPFPIKRASKAHDTSSDEEPAGPLQVVDNDPFEVIRRSMLGPSAVAATPRLIATAPTAHASAPDVRMSLIGESSPTKVGSLGTTSLSGHGSGLGTGMAPPAAASSPGKRQRRPSMAFFGSIRGLFRKPKEKERLFVEWGEMPPAASPPQRAKTTGWVTRTDARMKASIQSSEDEAPKGTRTKAAVPKVVNVRRSASGARLRKGRPGASRENGPLRAPSHRGMDGWTTDTPGGPASVDASGMARSRTRRGTMKRKKISVADLRGADQGHTDGEVDEGHPYSGGMSSRRAGKTPEASTSKLVIQIDRERQVVSAEADRIDVSTSTLHRRAATTTAALTRPPPSDVSRERRRSASLSLVDGDVMIISSSSSQATTQPTSWRKPPPQIEFQSLPPMQLPSQAPPSAQMYDSQPKQNARRQLGNGHAKHVQNQSLMSIMADVVRQNPTTDRAASLDIPRAPGSVLRAREMGAGHTRAPSVPEDGQGQVPQRVIQMPLKSALRRSPSPNPDPPTVVAARQEEAKKEGERDRRRLSATWRDSASMSSYETGRESLDGEDASPSPLVHTALPAMTLARTRPTPMRSQSLDLGPRSQTPPFTFPPPPVEPPPVHAGTAPALTTNGNEPPSSASTDQGVPRQKSVRVSLPPTFSPAPPVLRDEADEKERGKTRGKTREGEGDVWADSSDEDEGYARARRLLSLVGPSDPRR